MNKFYTISYLMSSEKKNVTTIFILRIKKHIWRQTKTGHWLKTNKTNDQNKQKRLPRLPKVTSKNGGNVTLISIDLITCNA